MTGALKLLALFVAINLLTYAAFAIDKRQARVAGWRISERSLLWLALIGGSLGAKIAQHRLRHKTQKQPFRNWLNAIVALHLILLGAGVAPSLREVAERSVAGLF